MSRRNVPVLKLSVDGDANVEDYGSGDGNDEGDIDVDDDPYGCDDDEEIVNGNDSEGDTVLKITMMISVILMMILRTRVVMMT